MKIFRPLYDKTLALSGHQHARWYLGGLSFAESSFFPIPPDVMLMPMTLAKPENWWRLALLTTIASVLGGVLGYFIGMFAFESFAPLIEKMGYLEKFELAQNLFLEWGILIVFAAGFSPIPYKVFTIAAGVAAMSLLPFILASLIGRGARFMLVAGLVAWMGPKVEPVLIKYIEWLGWLVVAILAIIIVIVQI